MDHATPRAPAKKKKAPRRTSPRLDQSRAELSTRLSARQLELESLTDRRRRIKKKNPRTASSAPSSPAKN